MELLIVNHNGTAVAEVTDNAVVVNTVQDALDLMANADYQGARVIIIPEACITPEFFNLKTGLAGEILQKYVNYGVKLAITGSFTAYNSNALSAFIIECNRGRHIFFTADRDEALGRLTG